MIVKSLSRHAGGAGTAQLISYILRYTATKKERAEPKKVPNKEDGKSLLFSKADIPFFNQALVDGKLTLAAVADFSALRSADIERELNAAIRIPKTSAIGSAFKKEQQEQKMSHVGTTLHLTPNYLIARNTDGVRFFRLTMFGDHEKKLANAKDKAPGYLIRHNLRSTTLKGWVREFEQLEALRIHKRSNNVSIYHHILSLSAKEKVPVTETVLQEIAEKFIELRGTDHAYIGQAHWDKSHAHLHLAMSAVDLAGRSGRISKAQFQEIKIALQEFQQERFPELLMSLPAHGTKGRSKDKGTVIENIKTRTNDIRGGIGKVLENAFASASSMEQFLSHVKQHYPVYERGGRVTGVTVDSRRWRFTTLGYTVHKLHELDTREHEQNKQLAALQALRGDCGRDKIEDRLVQLNKFMDVETGKDKGEAKDVRDVHNTSEDKTESKQPPAPETPTKQDIEQELNPQIESANEDRER